MFPPYAATIEEGLKAMLNWMDSNKLTAKDMPNTPWGLHPSCPHWSNGLSLAQASGILAQAKKERP